MLTNANDYIMLPCFTDLDLVDRNEVALIPRPVSHSTVQNIGIMYGLSFFAF